MWEVAGTVVVGVMSAWVVRELLLVLNSEELSERIEKKAGEAKSRRARDLLDKLLTTELYEKEKNYVEAIPVLNEKLQSTKELLDRKRINAEVERDELFEKLEAELKQKVAAIDAAVTAEVDAEKLAISKEVGDSRKMRNETADKIFSRAKRIDRFFGDFVAPEGNAQIDLRPVISDALASRIVSDCPKFSAFALKTFGIDENTSPILRDLVLMRSRGTPSPQELTRLISSCSDSQGKLKSVLTELLVEATLNDKGNRQLLFQSLRLCPSEHRLLSLVHALPLDSVVENLEISDTPAFITSCLSAFKCSLAARDDLEVLAEFCDKFNYTGGSALVDWEQLDSASLLVCRRLTNAEDYATKVKEVIRRQQAPVTRQPRKSIC